MPAATSGHMLATHQLRADARQFAFMPLRVQQKEGFANHQAQYGIAQKLKAFIVTCGR